MKSFLRHFLLVALLAAFPYSVRAADIVVKSGEKVGFLGDSITEQGSGPSYYVSLVIMGLKAEGIDATAIPAGRSG